MMKILLAVDDRCSEALAQTLAAQVAPGSAEFRIVHVLDIWTNRTPEMNAYYPGVEHSRDALKSTAQGLVERTAKFVRSKGFTVSTVVELGDPKSEIVHAAESWGADLIVLGSREGQPLRHFLMGGVLDAVVKHAHCSVEIVRMRS
jgi:nucleotide-binding universal stress UspA family protein